MKKISVKAVCGNSFKPDDFEHRPRVSAKIREHIINLVIENLLEPKKIMVEDQHKYTFVFDLTFAHDEQNEILWEINTREGIKTISIRIYDGLVTKELNPINYAYLLLEGIKVFLTEKYKKIKEEEVDILKEKIDKDYINSIPFPAPFKDQEYLGDTNPEVQKHYFEQFGS